MAEELPGYDFHYQVSGDAAVAPVQVFDDGQHLYIEFRNRSLIPALFVHNADGWVRLALRQAFPYLVADRLAPFVLVRANGMQATIAYAGGRALSGSGREAGSAVVGTETGPATLDGGARAQPEKLRGAAEPQDGNGAFRGELIFESAERPGGAIPAVLPRLSGRGGQETAEAIVRPASRAVTLAPLHEVDDEETAAAAQARPARYTVRPGETLSQIAFRYGLDAGMLAQWNRLRDANFIQAGQSLSLVPPGSLRSAGHQGSRPASAWRRAPYKPPHVIPVSLEWNGHERVPDSKSGAGARFDLALDTRLDGHTTFRVLERSQDGAVRARKVSSIDDIARMARHARSLCLRGNEADLAEQRILLAALGVSPKKIRLAPRKGSPADRYGQVDVLFEAGAVR